MVFLIRYYCDRFFCFFDSGDIQGGNRLRNIITIAEHTPDVRTWLPTRETGTVNEVLKEIGKIPDNLEIRVSAARINGPPPRGFANTSTVVSEGPSGPTVCPAPEQGGTCADCRMCWTSEVKNVIYRLH